MKTGISYIALLAILLTPTLTGVLRRKHKKDLMGFDKYFNQEQLNSESQTKENSPDGILNSMENDSPFERNLKQVSKKHRKKRKRAKKQSFDLEFRDTTNSAKNKIKQKKISLNNKGSKLGKRIRKLQNEIILGNMVQDIKKKAKKNHMKIKRVLLGEQVKQKFHEKNLATHLSKLLSMGNLQSHIKSTKRKLKQRKKKMLRKKRKSKKKKSKPNPGQMDPRTLASSMSSMSGGSSSKKGSDNLMKFNFLPGFAGMPFPPFMMNGPHFHPPLNVTVNSLPNPNPRAELDPKEIEEENVKTQLKALNPILSLIHI